MGESILVETLRNYLQQRRYVIVFDDIWSINAWESVKYALPDSKCGSRIVFTTRLTDIASSVETNPHIYSLQPLPEEEAWNLFSMKSLQGKQQLGVCPAELEELSYSILKKCGGLPLAIVVIGGLLSKKERTVFEWKKVYDSLAAEMKNDHSLESLGRILMISYNDLPYYLKLCYLYLSVFPEDYIIKRTKLTRLWLAERIVDEKQGLSMEEAAEQYIYELVSRSLIQVVEIDDFNKIRSCRVHDVMREILQLKSQEESLVTSVNGSSIILNEKIRRKSIHQNYDDFPLSMRFQGLRSLLLFKSGNSSRSSDNPFFNGFRLLRVLELELAPISQFPKELIALIHLRYLSLRRTMIRELPESIWKLKSLETLDLKSTLVSAMPVGILKLKNLHRLQCYRYHFHTSSFFADTYGMKVPSGIGCMTSLQKLGTVEVNEGIATELGKLSQLKKLGVVKLRKEDAGNLSSSLEKMRHLNSFYMVSINKNESIQLDSLSSPPQFLQHLYLKCPLVALPGWIASLQHLAKLVLQDSNLNVDLLKAFQNLPHLVILELRSAYTGEELCCDAVGYPRLKKLGLYQLEQLKHLRVAQGAMPGLKALDLTSCGVLEGVPLGIEHLNNLQELMLWDMPYRFLRQIQTPDESWKVQHISTIKIVYHAGGRWVVHNLN